MNKKPFWGNYPQTLGVYKKPCLQQRFFILKCYLFIKGLSEKVNLSKANQINKSRELGNLMNSSLTHRRILYSCMAVLNPIIPHLAGMNTPEIKKWIIDNGKEAHNLRTFDIDINDFSKTWEIGGNSLVEKVNLSVGYDPKTGSSPEIMKLCFRLKNCDDIEFVNVISSVKIKNGSGVISIVLTDTFLPYLINLTSYLAIPLAATVRFKSNYSFTMLEYLLNRYSQTSKYPIIQLKLDTLHMVLGTSHIKTYTTWTNLRVKILNKIVKDFSNIDGGGYDLEFKPIFTKGNTSGRPKVENVQIHFNNAGFKKFLATKAAQKQGLDSTKNASSETQQALKHYEIEQKKQRDIKISQEELGF